MKREQESSVVTSLAELTRMESDRRQSEAEERERQARARSRAEEESMIEARELAAREHERQREIILQRAIGEAHIEAEKQAQIEKSRMAVQLRLQADTIARQAAHARELAVMIDARANESRKHRWAWTSGIVAISAIAAVIAIGIAIGVNRRETPPPAIAKVTAKTDDSAERSIERLERELALLRAAPKPTAIPAPSTKPSVKVPLVAQPPKETGTKCPPGVHGIPLCP